mgnify:CR=1 FL=1
MKSENFLPPAFCSYHDGKEDITTSDGFLNLDIQLAVGKAFALAFRSRLAVKLPLLAPAVGRARSAANSAHKRAPRSLAPDRAADLGLQLLNLLLELLKLLVLAINSLAQLLVHLARLLLLQLVGRLEAAVQLVHPHRLIPRRRVVAKDDVAALLLQAALVRALLLVLDGFVRARPRRGHIRIAARVQQLRLLHSVVALLRLLELLQEVIAGVGPDGRAKAGLGAKDAARDRAVVRV